MTIRYCVLSRPFILGVAIKKIKVDPDDNWVTQSCKIKTLGISNFVILINKEKVFLGNYISQETSDNKEAIKVAVARLMEFQNRCSEDVPASGFY